MALKATVDGVAQTTGGYPNARHNSETRYPADRPEDSPARMPRQSRCKVSCNRYPGKRELQLSLQSEGASWLREHQSEIETSLDSPKSLQELQHRLHASGGHTVIMSLSRAGRNEAYPRSKMTPGQSGTHSEQKHQQDSDLVQSKKPLKWLRLPVESTVMDALEVRSVA